MSTTPISTVPSALPKTATIEMQTASLLERNLAALALRNPELAERLATVTAADVTWVTAADGVLSGIYATQTLASRHAPREEAEQIAARVDLREKATTVVLGFGFGYHIAALATRVLRSGLIVVLEPDFALLRAVLERIDHSAWLSASNVFIFDGSEETSVFVDRLGGSEAILTMGVHILEHPPSRQRLGNSPKKFLECMTELVRGARMTVSTALVRSTQTIQSVFRNARPYVGGAGLAPLKGIAQGRLGVVVSAGPSLRRNLHLLAQPGVRDRCIIIAVQTVLKPLLKEGIRPHFVASLDWHRISKRFFEGLQHEDVCDTTLILDPQANPVVAHSYAGPVRCIGASHFDKLLGPLAKPKGDLPAGATVAHLCYQIARYLGCDPVALIGQDLGFTDGLYYARGTAIDEVWAPELNPFNTIENLEWTRIVRHRQHLRKLEDVHGRPIYTDAQMESYLQRFEGFFLQDKRRGLTTIDATEGGVRKAGTDIVTLEQTLSQYALLTNPVFPAPSESLDLDRLRAAATRLRAVRADVEIIQSAAKRTAELLPQIAGDTPKEATEDRLWKMLDTERAKVAARLEAFGLLDEYSQVGVFRRAKSDRRIHFSQALTPVETQRLQFERDLVNVRWLAETGPDYIERLDETIAALESPVSVTDDTDDEAATTVRAERQLEASFSGTQISVQEVRAAFIVPIDLERGGLLAPRSLAEPLAERPILQRTLERLGSSRECASIILLIADDDRVQAEVEALLDRKHIHLPVEIHRSGTTPYDPGREAIAAARVFADSSWRGGIAGMTVYDELRCSRVAAEAAERFNLTAVVLVAPDWPLVVVQGAGGCDDLVRRHRVRPDLMHLVFSQAPPGLCGVLFDRATLESVRSGGRHATLGWMLGYEPTRPQQDPISKDICVQIPHEVRRSFVRATADSARGMQQIRRAIEPFLMQSGRAFAELDASTIIELLESQSEFGGISLPPQHLIVELCTGRQHSGPSSPHRLGSVQRTIMTRKRFDRLIEQSDAANDVVLTLAGAGDPLQHPDLADFIRTAKAGGIRAVHVRTELLSPRPQIAAMVEAGVDIVSVDLHADTAACYQRMTGVHRFAEAIGNLEYLMSLRTLVSGAAGSSAMYTPWIVPRLQRRVESLVDVESFFDRWQYLLGTPVLEGPPPFDATTEAPLDTLASARAPANAMYRELMRRLVVLSDGTIASGELDIRADQIVANVDRNSLTEIWRDVIARRRAAKREPVVGALELRTWAP
ncbi:MAG: DUF115 domain-containing protein [Phycisphaerales bacterium]|nr:DUF115 domain-containing protein [Phycisphaerales bacterium]